MMKILGIFLILAAVSLSGCIGEDVPADVTDDVIVDDVVDEVVEDVVDDVDDADDDIAEDVVDDAEEDVADEDDDNTVSLDEGTEGDYSSLDHFTGLRDDAQDAFNAAQALADDANVTIIAADEEVIRCKVLVAEGQMLLDTRSNAESMFNDASVATSAAQALYDADFENVTAAADNLTEATELSNAAWDAVGAWDANSTITLEDLETEYDALYALTVEAQDIVDELRAELAAAQLVESDALEAFNAAIDASNILGVTGMADRTAELADAQEAADSARLAFETLQEAADGKLTALEAAQDKLNSIVE